MRRVAAVDADPPRSTRSPPGVASLERFLEIVHVSEVLQTVLVLLHEDPAFDEGEHDSPDVVGRVNTPMFQNGPSEGSEPLESQIPNSQSQLASRDVAWRLKAIHDGLERRQDEQIPFRVEARVLLLESTQDLVGEL